MINEKLLSKLSQITEEEKIVLKGNKEVDTTIYMEKKGSVINSKKLLSAGKYITVRPHTRFLHFPVHSHDYIEMVYMCRGVTHHIVNGEKILLKEGEILFLGQNASHEILPAGENDIAVNFIVLPEFFDSPLAMLKDEEAPLKSFIVDSLKGESCYMHFKVSQIIFVQNLLENLIITLTEDTPNKRKISSFTMGLLFLQLMNCTDLLSYKSREENAIIKMFKYVDENYKDGSLTELCEILHYDFSWFSREIKKKTGKTYTEIVQERRLSQATFWLLNTNMNISDIAIKTGYDNVSYFHRLFYKKFGKTPRQYRFASISTKI